jgi:hypothetical protein
MRFGKETENIIFSVINHMILSNDKNENEQQKPFWFVARQ